MTDRTISNESPSRLLTIAARWSLSPNWISLMLTVSFSLTIGMIENSKSVFSVLRTLR